MEHPLDGDPGDLSQTVQQERGFDTSGIQGLAEECRINLYKYRIDWPRNTELTWKDGSLYQKHRGLLNGVLSGEEN